MVTIPVTRKIKLKKKNAQQNKTRTRKGKDELRILTSTGGFLVVKVLCSRQWTKTPSS